MSDGPDLHGSVAAGFEPVADAFLRNFTDHGDVGAACCLHVGGEPVVDVWAGTADPEAGRAWARDTIVLVFSSTKGVTAVAANQLIERGQLDPDVPVAEYWPEFAANGKADIPVEWVLSHRAGLAALDVPDLTLEDISAWDPVVDAIAAQEPNWEPGTAHGYHARTFGWIVGELIRRITGKMPGEYVATEIAGPLGLDLIIGVPESEDGRVARMLPARPGDDPELERLASEALSDQSTLLGRVMSGPSQLFAYDERWNGRTLRSAQMPSSNGHSDARSLSRMYAACLGEVEGVRLLAPETVERATVPRSTGKDCVIGQPLHFGLGFSLPPTLGLDPGPRSFGHAGAGGSLAFADPDRDLAFRVRDEPAVLLVDGARPARQWDRRGGVRGARRALRGDDRGDHSRRRPATVRASARRLARRGPRRVHGVLRRRRRARGAGAHRARPRGVRTDVSAIVRVGATGVVRVPQPGGRRRQRRDGRLDDHRRAPLRWRARRVARHERLRHRRRPHRVVARVLRGPRRPRHGRARLNGPTGCARCAVWRLPCERGPDVHRVGAALPRRVPRLARGQRPARSAIR